MFQIITAVFYNYAEKFKVFVLGWKGMAVTNKLAYYDPTTITAVKSFIVQGPGERHEIKLF